MAAGVRHMDSGLPWNTVPAKPFTQDVPQACFSDHMGCRKSLYICQLAMPKNLGFVFLCKLVQTS